MYSTINLIQSQLIQSNPNAYSPSLIYLTLSPRTPANAIPSDPIWSHPILTNPISVSQNMSSFLFRNIIGLRTLLRETMIHGGLLVSICDCAWARSRTTGSKLSPHVCHSCMRENGAFKLSFKDLYLFAKAISVCAISEPFDKIHFKRKNYSDSQCEGEKPHTV